MTDKPRWFQTTAIDYPNSRPHIGTAFEKLGADVQARYRRMEGFDVFFLMGNDENTVKVSKRAAELGQDTQAYCDDMAKQFREVWDALDISYDTFVQTSSERHKQCCRKFIQKVYDNGHIYKGSYEGLYCEGCEAFKTEKEVAPKGECPLHPGKPVVKRTEPCYFFRQSTFEARLLAHYEAHPEFIQPDSRRNEIIEYVKSGLKDVNISRTGQTWGINIPFDPEFTIYVWFDALLTYITGIGYGDDEGTFKKYWPASVHFIGKDITRFHCALWPAMLWAAGEELPKQIFGHGFVQRRDESGELVRESKTLGNVTDPMEIISKFSSEAFRYYFLRECPYPSDGEFGWARFAEIYNSELANNLGNMLSRCLTLITKNFGGRLDGTGGSEPVVHYLSYHEGKILRQGFVLVTAGAGSPEKKITIVADVVQTIEECDYSSALQLIVNHLLTPANQYLEVNAPWKLVKTDKDAAKRVLFNAVQSLRIASILLKPFIPKSAEAIYTSFNFPIPWADVKYADAAELKAQPDDLRITAELIEGKPKPLFPRIG